MQPKFTLKRVSSLTWLTPVFFVLFLLIAGKVNAQQYINGNLSTGATHVGTGTVAPAGTTWSELQGTNSTLGSGANITAGYTLADNFVVPAGPSWALTKITFYAYSTGFAGATSPFVDTRVQIFNTDPSVGSPVPVFGDLSTNRFLASSFASIYRTSGTTADQSRKVWKIEATVNTTLAPGTYWIEWQHGNGGISNFTPPSTVAGQPTPPGGNSKQHDLTLGTWTNLVDAGGGGAQDQFFIIDYATAACSGTPSPGATLPATSAVCPGVPFTLSLQNATPGSGVTYQWQSGPSSTGPWANISGAINSTYSSTLTATTYYQCNVTCSGNTATSSPAVVNLNLPSACYCIPPATDCSDDDEIIRVRLNTLDNASGCSAPSGYANYTLTVPAPIVIAGAANPITVNFNTVWSKGAAVWIDYNKNGQFETTEFTSLGTGAGAIGQLTANINIPANALTGVTRMRVRTRFGATAWLGTAACTNPSSFGETEDYNVDIQPCVPVTITSSPASASITCGTNASFTVAATGSLPVYSWEWRPNSSSAWFTVTDGGIYSGATTTTLTLTNVSAANSGYQYRAVVVGACSATDVSQTAILTVNPIIATVSPVSSTICKGSIVPLTLTNASAPSTVTFTNNTPLLIPDGAVAGVFSTINVSGIPAGAIITNVSIKLNITHTYVGDLEISVKAPNAVIMNLIGELDGGTGSNSSDDFVNTVISSTGTTPLSGAPAPRTGTFAADRLSGYGPSGAYQTLPNGMPWSSLLTTINGNWVLGLSDWYAGDEGTLQNWSISITYGAPAAGVWQATPSVLPQPNSMFSDALATVPYVAGTPATTIYVKPDVSTNYSVVYSTTTPCTSAATVIPVTVNFPVTGLAVAPATRAVCLGGSTTFTASVTGGSPVTYQWQQSVDGGLVYTNISGATGSTLTLSGVTASMTGYKYRVVATGGVCGAVTSTTNGTLTVNALPVVTISSPDMMIIPGQTTSITATSTPAAQATNSWSWTYNGAAITGNTNVISGINIDQIGTYQARVTDVNGCVNSSASLVIGAEVSDKLWIYPNPTTGDFFVRLYFGGELTEIRKVSLYNPMGQLIESREITLLNNANPYQRMDFSLGGNIAKGTYVVKVAHKNSGKIISGLIVVQ